MANINVTKRADGSLAYRVRFRLDAGANPVSETFSTLPDAQRFAELVDTIGGRAARELRDATDTASNSTTLRTAVDQYCDHVATYAARGTAPEYRRMAERTFLKFFNDALPLHGLTRPDVEKWVAWQRTQPTYRGGTYSHKSIKSAQGLLSSVLAYQVELGNVNANVAKNVRIPKDEEKRERVFLTPNEFVSLFDAIREDFQPMVGFIYATGLRWGEVTALKATDFQLDEYPATVRVSRAWKKSETGQRYLGSPKSRAGTRTVSIPPSTVDLIRERVQDARAHGGFVFHQVTNTQKPIWYNNFSERIWNPAVERAGLPVRPTVHDLRHSHVSGLIAQGVPLPVIQRRLGHESIQTTVDVYGHLAPDAHAGAAEAVERLMSNVLPAIES